MKNFKRIASVVMVLMMMLSMMLPAMAGTITINNAKDTETYTAYKIFDVTNSGANYAYTIKVDSVWHDIIDDYKYKGAKVFTLTPSANDASVKVITYDSAISTNTELAADLAATLSKKLAEMTSAPTGINGTYSEGASTITVTEAGYYFVTTSLGTLCFLDTAAEEFEITEKNVLPTIDKLVQEDSDNEWYTVNDADIGDVVNFKTTINAYKGARNYVLHDEMVEGLTLNTSNIVVTEGSNTLEAGNQYTLTTTGLTDTCDFEIAFTQEYLDTITGTATAPTQIIVTYSATLNDNAIVAGDGNKNETWLTYGENSVTDRQHTLTYTWETKIFKYTGENETPLANAKFVVYRLENEVKKYYVKSENNVDWVELNENTTVAAAVESGEITSFVSDTTGYTALITGIDAATYYLHEYEAPEGYNLLTTDTEVTVTSATYVNTDNATLTGTVSLENSEKEAIKIENKTGTELPSTGGIGTTIFYCAGAILAVGAFVLLITKKRMGKEV